METQKSEATGGAPTSKTEHHETRVQYITHYFTLGQANYRLAVLESSEQSGPSNLADLDAATVLPGEEVWFVDSQLPVDQDECIIWKWALTDMKTAKERSLADMDLQAEKVRVIDIAWVGGQAIAHSRDSSLTDSIEPVALIGIVGEDEELSEPEKQAIVESAKAVVQAVTQAAGGKMATTEEDLLAKKRGKSPISITLEEMADKQAFATDVAKRVVNLAQKQIRLDEQEHEKTQGGTEDTKQLETRRTSMKNFEELVGDEDITKQAVHLAKLEMVAVSLGSNGDGESTDSGGKVKGKAKKGKKQKKSNDTLNEMVKRSLFAAGIAKNVIKLAQMQVYSNETGTSLVHDAGNKESVEGVSPQEESVISDILNGIRTLKRRKQVRVDFDSSWDKNGNLSERSKEERTILVPTVDNRYMQSRGLDLTEQSVELKFRPSLKDLTPESDYSGEYDSVPMEIETKASTTLRRKSLVDEIPDSVQYQIYRRMSLQDPTCAATLRELRESASSDNDSDNKDEIDRIIDLLPHVDLRMIHRKYFHEQDQVVPTMRPVHSHTLRLDGTYNEEEEMETEEVSLDEEKADEISRLVYNLCRRYSLHEVENLQLYKRMSIIPGATPLSFEITPDMACYTAHPDSDEDDFARPEQEESSISMTLDPTPTFTLHSQNIETQFGDRENRYRKFLLEAESGQVAAETGLAVRGEMEYQAVDPGAREVTMLSQQTETLECQLESAPAAAEGDSKLKYSVIDAGRGDETMKPIQQTETLEFQLESAPAAAEGDCKLKYSVIDAGRGDETMKPIQQTETLEFQLESAPATAEGDSKLKYSVIDAGRDDETMKPIQQTETLEFQLEGAPADAKGDSKLKYSVIDAGSGEDTTCMKPIQQTETLESQLESALADAEGDTFNRTIKYSEVDPRTVDETMKPGEQMETIPYCFEDAQVVPEGDTLDHKVKYPSIDPGTVDETMEPQEVVTEPYGFECIQKISEEGRLDQQDQYKTVEPDIGVEMAIDQDLETLKYEVDSTQIDTFGDTLTQLVPEQSQEGHEPSPARSDDDFVFVHENADQQVPISHSSSGSSGDADFVMVPNAEESRDQQKTGTSPSQSLSDAQMIIEPQVEHAGSVLQEAPPIDLVAKDEKSLEVPEAAERNQAIPPAGVSLEQMSVIEPVPQDSELPSAVLDQGDMNLLLHDADSHRIIDEAIIADVSDGDSVHEDSDASEFMEVGEKPSLSSESSMEFEDAPDSKTDFERNVVIDEEGPVEQTVSDVVSQLPQNRSGDTISSYSPAATIEARRLEADTIEIAPQKERAEEDAGPPKKKQATADLREHCPEVEEAAEQGLQVQMAASEETIGVPAQSIVEFISPELYQGIEEGKGLDRVVTDLDKDTADNGKVGALTTDIAAETDIQEQSPEADVVVSQVDNTLERGPLEMSRTVEEGDDVAAKQLDSATELQADADGQLGIRLPTDLEDGELVEQAVDDEVSQLPQEFIEAEPDLSELLIKSISPVQEHPKVDTIEIIPQEGYPMDDVGLPGANRTTDDLHERSREAEEATERSLRGETAATEDTFGVPIQSTLEFIHPVLNQDTEAGASPANLITDLDEETVDPNTLSDLNAETGFQETSTTETDVVASPNNNTLELGPLEVSRRVEEGGKIEVEQPKVITDLDGDTADGVRLTTDLDEDSDFLEQCPADPKMVRAQGESTIELVPLGLKQTLDEDGRLQDKLVTDLDADISEEDDDEDGRILRTDLDEASDIQEQGPGSTESVSPNISTTIQIIPPELDDVNTLIGEPLGATNRMVTDLDDDADDDLIGLLNPELSKSTETLTTDLDADSSDDDDYALPTEESILTSQDAGTEDEQIVKSLEVRTYTSEEAVCSPDVVGTVLEVRTATTGPVTEEQKSKETVRIPEAEVITVATTTTVTEATCASITYEGENIPDASKTVLEVPFLGGGQDVIDLIDQTVAMQKESCDPVLSEESSSPDFVSQCPFTDAVASGPFGTPFSTIFFRTHYTNHLDGECVAVVWNKEGSKETELCQSCMGEEIPTNSGFWYMFGRLPAGSKVEWKLVLLNTETGSLIRCEERPFRTLVVPNVYTLIDALWAFDDTQIDVHNCERQMESIPFSYDVLRGSPESSEEAHVQLESIAEEKDELSVERQDSSTNFDSIEAYSESLEEGIMSDATFLAEQLSQFVPSASASGELEGAVEGIDLTENPVPESMPLALDGEEQDDRISEPPDGVTQIPLNATAIANASDGAVVPHMTDVFFRTHYLVHSDDEYVAVIGDSDYLGNWKVHTSIGEELPKGSGFWYVYCKLPAGLKINWKLIVFDRRQGHFLRFEERPNRKLLVPSTPIMVDVLWAYYGETPIKVNPEENDLESIPFSFEADVPEGYRDRRMALFGKALNFPAKALKYDSMRVAQPDEIVPENLAALAKEVLAEDVVREEPIGGDQGEDITRPTRRVSRIHKAPFDIQLALVPYMTDVFIRTHYLVHSDDEYVAVIGDSDFLGNWKIHTSFGEELPKGSGFWYVYCKLPAGLGINWKLIVFNRREGRFLRFEERPNRELVVPSHPMMIDALWGYGQTPIKVHPDETELESIPFSYPVDIPEAYRNRRAEFAGCATNLPPIALKYESLKVLIDTGPIPDNLAALAQEVLSQDSNKEDVEGSFHEPERDNKVVRERRVSIVHDITLGFERQIDILNEPSDKEIVDERDIDATAKGKQQGLEQQETKAYPESTSSFSQTLQDGTMADAEALVESLRQKPSDAAGTPGNIEEQIEMTEQPIEESVPFLLKENDREVGDGLSQTASEADATPATNYGALVPFMTDVFFRTHHLVNSDDEYVAVIGDSKYLGNLEVHTRIGEELPKGSGFWYVYCRLPAGLKINWKLIVFDRKQGRFLHFEERPNRKLVVPSHPIMVDVLWGYGQTPIEVHPDEIKLECIPFSYVVEVPEDYRNRREELMGDALNIAPIALKYESLRVAHEDEEVPAALANEVLSDDVPVEEGRQDAIQTTDEQVPVRPVTLVHEVPFEVQGALVPFMTDVFFRTHRLVDTDDEHVAVIGETELLGDRNVHTSIGEELPKGSGFWYVYCKLPAGAKLNWKLIVFDPEQGRFLHFENRPNRKLTVPCHPIMVDALWSYGQTPIEVYPDKKELESIPFSYIVDVPEAYRNRRAAFFADVLDSPAIALKYESLRVTHDEDDIPANLAALAEEVLEGDEGEDYGDDRSEKLDEPVRDKRVSIAQEVPFEIQGALVPYMTDVFFRTHYLVHSDDEQIAVIGDSDYLGNWKVHTGIGEELPKGSGFWYVYCKLPAGLNINWKLIVFDRRKGLFLRFEERPNRTLTIPSYPIMVDALWAYGQTPIGVHPDETELESIPFSYSVNVPEAYRKRRRELYAEEEPNTAIALKYESLKLDHGGEEMSDTLGALAKEVLSTENVISSADAATQEIMPPVISTVPERRVSVMNQVPFRLEETTKPCDVEQVQEYIIPAEDGTKQFEMQIEESAPALLELSDKELEDVDVDATGQARQQRSELPETDVCKESMLYSSQSLEDGTNTDAEAFKSSDAVGAPSDIEEQIEMTEQPIDESVPSLLEENDKKVGDGLAQTASEADATPATNYGALVPFMTDVFFRTHHLVNSDDEYVAVIGDSKYLGNLEVHTRIGEELPKGSGFWYVYCRLPAGLKINWKLIVFDRKQGRFLHFEERPNRKLVVPSHPIMVDVLWGYGQTPIEVHPDEIKLECIPFSYVVEVPEDYRNRREELMGDALNISPIALKYESLRVAHEDEEVPAALAKEVLSDDVPVEERRPDAIQNLDEQVPVIPVSLVHEVPFEVQGALVPYMTDVFFRTHRLVDADDEHVAVIGETELLGDRKVHTSIGEELPKGSGFWYVYCKLPAGSKLNWKLIVFDPEQGRFLHFEDRPNRKLTVPCHPIMVDALWSYGQTPIEVYPDKKELESIPFSYIVDVPEAYRNRRAAFFAAVLDSPAIALKYESLRVTHDEDDIPANLAALAEEVLEGDEGEDYGDDRSEMLGEPLRDKRVSIAQEEPFEIQGALVPYMTDVFFRTHYLVHSDDEQIAVIGDSDYLGNWKVHTGIGEELPKGSGFWYVYCKLPAGLNINWKLIVFDRRKGLFLRFEERPNRTLTIPSYPIMVDALWAYGQTPIGVHPDEKELESIPFSYSVNVPEAYRKRRRELYAEEEPNTAIALKYESLKLDHGGEEMSDTLGALAKEVLSTENVISSADAATQEIMPPVISTVPERRVSVMNQVPFRLEETTKPCDVEQVQEYIIPAEDGTKQFEMQIEESAPALLELSDKELEDVDVDATGQARQQRSELPETDVCKESMLYSSQSLEDGTNTDAEAFKSSDAVGAPSDIEEQIEMTEQPIDESVPSLLEENDKKVGDGLAQTASEADATPATNYGALVPFMTDVFFRTHHLVNSDDEYVAVIGDSKYLGNLEVHTRIGEELPKGSGFWYVYCRLPAGLKINWKLIVFDRKQGRFLHFEERPNRKLVVPSHPIMVDVLWGYGQTPIEVHPDEIKLECIPFSYVVEVPEDYRNRREELMGDALNISPIALKYESLRVAHEDEEVPAALAKEVLSDDVPVEERRPDAIQNLDEQVPVIPVSLVHEVPFAIQGALVPYMTDVFFRTHRLVDADDEHVAVIGETELLGDRKVHTSIGEELPKGSGFWYVYCKLPAGSKLNWKLIVFDPEQGRFLHFEDRPNRKLTVPCHPIMVDALWSYGQTPIEVYPDKKELESIPFSYIVDVPEAYRNRRAAFFAAVLDSPAIALKYESLRVTHDEDDIPANLAALAEEVLEGDEEEDYGDDRSEMLGEPLRYKRVSIAQEEPFEIQGALVPYMTDVFFRTHYLVHSDDEQIAVIGDSDYLGNWKVHTGIGEELPKGSGFWYVYCKLPAGLNINWKLIVFDRRKGLFLRFEERPNRTLTIPSYPIMVDALWAYGQTPIGVHPDETELESIPFSYSVNVPEAYRKRRRELYAEEEPNTAIALKYESLKLDHGGEEMSDTLGALAKEVLSTEDVISSADAATQETKPPVISTVPERRVSVINQVPFRLEETTKPCDVEQVQECMIKAEDGPEKFAEVLIPEEVVPCHPSPQEMVIDPSANIIITTQQRQEEVAATRLDTVPFEQGIAFETAADVVQNASQTPNVGEHVAMELQAALSHEITTVEKTAVDYTNTDLTPQDPMKTIYISRQEDVELEEPMTVDESMPTPKEYRVLETAAQGPKELIESYNDLSGNGLQVTIQPTDVFEGQRTCISPTTERPIITEGLGPIEQSAEMITGVTQITELQSAQTSEEVISVDQESTEKAGVLIIEEPQRKRSITEPRPLVTVDLQQESPQAIEESMVMERAESQEPGVPFSVHPDAEHSAAMSETSLVTEGTAEDMVSISEMQTEVPETTVDSYHEVAIQESSLPTEGVKPYDVDNVESLGDVPQITHQTTEIQVMVGSEEVGPMEPEHALNVPEENAPVIERKVSITAPRPTMEVDQVCHEVTEMKTSNIGTPEIQDIGYGVEDTTSHIVALSEKSEAAEEIVSLEPELSMNLEGVELTTQVEEKISAMATRPLAEIDPVSDDVTAIDTVHMETPETQVIAFDTVPIEGHAVALTEKAIGVEEVVPYDEDHFETFGDVPEVTLQTTEIQVVVGCEEVGSVEPEQALTVSGENDFVVERKISVTSPRPLSEIDLLSHEEQGTEAGEILEMKLEIAGSGMEVFTEHVAALQEATVPTEGMPEDTQKVSELEIPPAITTQVTEREAAVVMDSRATEGVSEVMEKATMQTANVKEEPCAAIEGADGRDRPVTEIMAVDSDTQQEVTLTFTGELHTEEVVINIQSTGENVVVLQEEMNIPEESSPGDEPVEIYRSKEEVIIDPGNIALNVKNVTVVEKAPFIQVELAETAPESTIEVAIQQANTVNERPISQTEMQLEFSEQSSTEDICVTPLERANQKEVGDQQPTITTEIAMPVETVHESSQIKMEVSQATMEVEGMEGQLTAITEKTIPEEDVAVDSPDLDSVALISDYATIEMQQTVTDEIAVVEKTVLAENAAGPPDDVKEGNISELNTIIRTYMSGLDPDDRLGVTGDLPELGNWKTIRHFAVENPPGSGLWYIHLTLPRGVSFWWKLVQGSPDGSEIRKWEDHADRRYIAPKTGDSLIDVLWSSEEKVVALSDVTTEMTEIPFDYGEVKINTEKGIVGVTKVDDLTNGFETNPDTSVPGFEYRLPDPKENINVNVKVDVKQPLPHADSRDYGSEASMQTAHEFFEDFDDEHEETKKKLGKDETTLDFDNEVTAEVRERELLWVLKSQSEIQVCIGPRRGREGDEQASAQLTHDVSGRITNGVAGANGLSTGVQDLEPGVSEGISAERTSTRTWFRTHRFVDEGLCIGVTGSLQELGAWDPSAAVIGVEHPVGSGFWYIDSRIRVGEKFQWKLALIDQRTKVVKEEEERDRREHCIPSRPVLIDTLWSGIDRVNLVEDVADESDLKIIPPLSEDKNFYTKDLKHIDEQLSNYHLDIDIERVSETQGTRDQEIKEEEHGDSYVMDYSSLKLRRPLCKYATEADVRRENTCRSHSLPLPDAEVHDSRRSSQSVVVTFDANGRFLSCSDINYSEESVCFVAYEVHKMNLLNWLADKDRSSSCPLIYDIGEELGLAKTCRNTAVDEQVFSGEGAPVGVRKQRGWSGSSDDVFYVGCPVEFSREYPGSVSSSATTEALEASMTRNEEVCFISYSDSDNQETVESISNEIWQERYQNDGAEAVRFSHETQDLEQDSSLDLTVTLDHEVSATQNTMECSQRETVFFITYADQGKDSDEEDVITGPSKCDQEVKQTINFAESTKGAEEICFITYEKGLKNSVSKPQTSEDSVNQVAEVCFINNEESLKKSGPKFRTDLDNADKEEGVCFISYADQKAKLSDDGEQYLDPCCKRKSSKDLKNETNEALTVLPTGVLDYDYSRDTKATEGTEVYFISYDGHHYTRNVSSDKGEYSFKPIKTFHSQDERDIEHSELVFTKVKSGPPGIGERSSRTQFDFASHESEKISIQSDVGITSAKASSRSRSLILMGTRTLGSEKYSCTKSTATTDIYLETETVTHYLQD